ncbi:DUF397 domain-containing protein [Spirillospora sp. NPDC048824]|uniref:DUF397 domain-containing protein n=1 Tax=Spirillospora sp. NPDC048824 TaxID=3364526 RepID=UPI0037154FC2
MDLSEAAWRKASKSHEEGDACIEVTAVPGLIAVRDSKDPDGPKIILSRANFRYLSEALKHL